MAKILIVEDRPADRRYLADVVLGEGHDVLVARDGHEALAIAVHAHPQLAISDILMPGMDGYEFARRLRAIPALARVPVIFMSATYHEHEARALAEAYGVAAVLDKPSDPGTILAAVDAALRQTPPAAQAADRDLSNEHLRIVNAKLLQKVRDLEDSERRYAALITVARQLDTQREPAALLREICTASREVTGAQYAVLGVLASDGDLTTMVTGGFPGEAAATERWLTVPHSALVAEVLGDSRPVRHTSPKDLRTALGLSETHPGITSCLGVQLRSPARVLGWLILMNKRSGEPSFSQGDCKAASIIGLQAGIALDNLGLVGRIQEYAARLEQEVDQRGRAEREFRELADAMPQIVWAAGADGVTDYLNRQGHQLIRSSSQETLPPEGWMGLIVAEDKAAVAEAWRAATSNGTPYQSECRLRDGGGEASRWFLVRGVPMTDPSGRVLRWFGTCTDIDEQKRTEQQLRTASRVRDEFLAVVSHELRTPLNAVMGWARLLETTGAGTHRAERAVEAIGRNGRALARAIDDLFDISGLIAGNLTLQTELVSLTTITEAALDTVSMAADAKGVEIVRNLPGTAIWVFGDAHRLKQVVWNLLTNAVKFTDRGGRIGVSLAEVDGRAVVRVADSGIGIEPDFLPFVFDRFRQADSSPTRGHGGLGLGLSIARHFAELHGGSVRAESAGLGCGAAFTLDLPIQVAGRQNTGARPGHRRPRRPRLPSAVRPELAGLAALIADDDADSRELLRRVLERSGVLVTAVASVGEAMECLSQRRFAIIVSDIAMPHEDGYTFITRVRASESWRSIPAIAVSGYKRAQDQERALASGFQRCLAKPVDIDAFLDAVSECLSASAPRSMPERIGGDAAVTTSAPAAPPSGFAADSPVDNAG